MSALTLVVTDAGRAALVNATHNGTTPVLLAAVGVTDQAFTAAADTAALPGELKRLTTFAGAAVAADTLHVSIRDDSAASYSLRGFALYLDDGTLFASYGQAEPIGEKSAQSMFLLALDVIFTDIAAESLTFGDTNFLLASATTEQEGIVELATDSEAVAHALGAVWNFYAGFYRGIWDGLKAKVAAVVDWVLGKVEWIANTWQSIKGLPGAVCGDIKQAGTSIGNLVSGPALAGAGAGGASVPMKLPAARGASGGNVTYSTNAPITINATPGMDERKLAQQVRRELDERDRAQAARRRSTLGDLD